MKVGMDDPSSVEFVERRRAALERCGSIYDLHSDIINVMSSFFVVVFFITFSASHTSSLMPLYFM